MRKNLIIIIVLVASSLAIICCKKDPRNKPAISFNNDVAFVHTDTVITKGTAFKIGVNVTKKEDDLKTYTASLSLDGSSKSNFTNSTITGGEKAGFSREHSLTARNQTGKEVYEFTIADADGNINSISLTVTVK
ncbi:MAG: hypothetical protein NTX03_10380 [Bacteroidetes bacterium]|nr:hypothetical protein [Bacteroidota bacterium]